MNDLRHDIVMAIAYRDGYDGADAAIDTFRDWLTSDATVERVARALHEAGSLYDWDEVAETYRKRARAALAAALASEGEAS